MTSACALLTIHKPCEQRTGALKDEVHLSSSPEKRVRGPWLQGMNAMRRRNMREQGNLVAI